MRVVVTGGAGFIGSAFINYLLDNFECEVLCVDKLTYAGRRNNIKHDVSFLHKDICDVTEDELGEFEYIVHFAAESHVDNSISNGLPFVRTNVEGTFNLLEITRKNKKLKKFIHISTDEVYGDMDEHFAINHTATETDKLKTSSYYSATKWWGVAILSLINLYLIGLFSEYIFSREVAKEVQIVLTLGVLVSTIYTIKLIVKFTYSYIKK